jgi:hypothetical protein
MARKAESQTVTDSDFSIVGAPSGRLTNTLLAAARSAKARLQKQWPRPLSVKTIRMIWYDTKIQFEKAAGQRSDGILALADKQQDVVLLNGPELRRAGSDAIETTLHHELVHINLARVGIDRLPRWLEEGLAMRLAGQYRWSDAWQASADRLFGTLESSEALWGDWNGSQESLSRAYRQAASLTDFFLRERFPQDGEEGLLSLLFSPGHGDAMLDELWTPYGRAMLYMQWTKQGGKLGAWVSFLAGPTMLFGGVGVVLLTLAFIVKRRRAMSIERAWQDEGPYFSEAPEYEDEEESGEYEDESDDEDEDDSWR